MSQIVRVKVGAHENTIFCISQRKRTVGVEDEVVQCVGGNPGMIVALQVLEDKLRERVDVGGGETYFGSSVGRGLRGWATSTFR